MSDSGNDSTNKEKASKVEKPAKRDKRRNTKTFNKKDRDSKKTRSKTLTKKSTANTTNATTESSQADGEYIFESPEQQQLRNESEEFFKNKKKRRASSVRKKFFNDHIGLSEVNEISDLLAENNDEGILFSDRTSRLSHRSHMSECIFIISTNFIYFLNSHLGFEEDMEPLPISTLKEVATSTEEDNAIILLFDDYKSQLFMTPYKIELMMILKSQYKKCTGEDLKFTFSDVVEFPVNADTLFEVNFIETTDGIRMTLYCKANNNKSH